MQTVFSHVVQKRFSQVNEDVATDALAFILQSSEAARAGMIKLLRAIAPELPVLAFRTQQTEGSIRPDMWGYDRAEPRVFVENKFWAGLTENQPVSYLKQLAQRPQPTVLLVTTPDARAETLWRELRRRLADASVSVTDRDTGSGTIVRATVTGLGPALALTTWTRLLTALELEVAEDPSARSDLRQLRALCVAADSDAFIPIAPETVSDQRTPAFILQLGSLVQASVELAVAEGVLSTKGLMPQASWERIGRYARFWHEQGVGIWFGIHLGLWKRHGATPLWVVFSATDFGRASEVQPKLEPWAASHGVVTASEQDELAVAVTVALGEDKDRTVRAVVDRLRDIADALCALDPTPDGPEVDRSVPLPDDLREFVDSSVWTFAKTMPEWPHEYIVRERVDEGLFVRLVQHIRDNGYDGRFYRKRMIYYEDRGLVYWTMGAPLEETTIINRCKKEDAYEYRRMRGTLPPDRGAAGGQ